jgi:hypothetical protein
VTKRVVSRPMIAIFPSHTINRESRRCELWPRPGLTFSLCPTIIIKMQEPHLIGFAVLISFPSLKFDVSICRLQTNSPVNTEKGANLEKMIKNWLKIEMIKTWFWVVHLGWTIYEWNSMSMIVPDKCPTAEKQNLDS